MGHVLLLGLLLVIQLCLGVVSYIEKMAAANSPQRVSPAIEITAAHVAVGALVLASSLALTFQVFGNVAAPRRTLDEAQLEEDRQRMAASCA